ncbi:hypothetical protein F4804DRAFT_304325 [Jackrogersella minutella]|nr:hypothetical protein F4804DRAFT_304325 [Jackrogersella minutella]
MRFSRHITTLRFAFACVTCVTVLVQHLGGSWGKGLSVHFFFNHTTRAYKRGRGGLFKLDSSGVFGYPFNERYI